MKILRILRSTRCWILTACLTGIVACQGTSSSAQHDDEHSTAEHAEEHTDATHDAPMEVTLDTAAIRIGGIRVQPVDTVHATALSVTGTITYDGNRISHVGPRTNGRIVRLHTDLGATVSTGQPLVVLESPDVGQLHAELHQATTLVAIAKENHTREQRLADQGISSRKELLDATAELSRSEAALRATQERLRVLGAEHETGGQFTLRAPFSGVIVARHASLGEMVSPSDTLFIIADLSRLWIELDIFERDVHRVRNGQSVVVTVAAYPGRTFPGRIVYLGDVVSDARTIRARVEIPNPNRILKPGMFASANIHVDAAKAGASTQVHVVVPQEAVQQVEGQNVVFVPGKGMGTFRAIPVEVGDVVAGNRVVIRTGLDATSRVVTQGAFALRSELSKAELDEHGHAH